MREIVHSRHEIGYYVAERANCTYDPLRDQTLGVVSPSINPFEPPRIRGGVIVTNYTGVSCALHMAGEDEMWTTRDFIWMVFDYTFNQLGCARVFGLVEEANTLALKIDRKLGFREIARIPGMFASGDALVLQLTRADCRWLRVRPRTIGPRH